ncbi:MAG: DUF547 domain-containing protein [Thermodesulfobacteriota bacterium]|nr:DUF547 domain-containing protein [Thermodesulfobacteriota bacterium]
MCVLWVFSAGDQHGWSTTTEGDCIYAQLLQKYVQDGHVDYSGFKKEEEKLNQYLGVLEKIDSQKLSRDEEFAFYINAYNAWTIKLVLSGYPGIKSIKDLGSFLKSPWKRKICRIDGTTLSLDDIEHKVLRPRFQDPRVHFAINCASISCPPLISDPYKGSMLDLQLDRAVKAFINDPARNYLDVNTLYVSKIFDWFAEDFDNNIVGFVFKYAQGDLEKRLQSAPGKIAVKYLEYDWSLNGR